MTYSEQFRRECEAREWLRRTDSDPERIKDVLERIKSKRGKEAAEILRQDMRTAFQTARSGAATR
jgi:DNA-binding GntR family transcriptional regulator